MTDSKQKCQGCGADTMSDVGWCPACRSILYTPLQIAESDFRRSEFNTMVFPVRDIVWLQDRLRLRDAEIKAMDTVNDEMAVTIFNLRAELAALRAELEQARRWSATLWRVVRAYRGYMAGLVRDTSLYMESDDEAWRRHMSDWSEIRRAEQAKQAGE